MKISNKIMILLLSVMLPMGFAGCSDDDDEGIPNPNEGKDIPEFIIGQESIRVKIGSKNAVTIDVKQGGGEYDAFILDESVAKAEVTNGVIKVEGFANGQTSLMVSDKYSRYRKVPVAIYTTDKLQLSHEVFDLVTVLGTSKTLKANVVSGNGGYVVVSDNPAVSVSVDEEGVISMAATSKKLEFMANVTVTDCTNLSASIAVKVTASLEAFLDEDLATIMANASRRYYFDGSSTGYDYYTFLNEITEESKQRYGWQYYDYYYCFCLDFVGDKSVGTKEDAIFTYYTWSDMLSLPVTLKIIKNDGTNIWGIFSYMNDEEEKLHAGYFCDTVEK